ncbi:MAG: IS1380 family transposase [Planctomycetes bacterium]|nr:IS1380 family transposase [Planctomycetota bacterium]
MFGFDEVRAGDEALTSVSGLVLLGLELRRSGLSRLMDAIEPIGRPDRTSGGTIATSLCGLIALGHPDFDRIEPLRKDPVFGRSLGLKKIPSSPTLRQRAEVLFGATRGNESEADLSVRETTCQRAEGAVREAMTQMQRTSGLRPTPLPLPDGSRAMPVDMDTTVLEEWYGTKEGVGCTYQKVPGYSPMMAYIGREGYILDAELRPGPQSAFTGTCEAIARAREMSRAFVSATMVLLFRIDGGCDSKAVLDELEKRDADRYIVAHNRRGQSLESWLETARTHGIASTPRPGKTVWFGETHVEYGKRLRRCVFRVAVRTSEANGQQLIVPDIEVRLLWTNLSFAPEEVFVLYADHGTSEQFHAEYKSQCR